MEEAYRKLLSETGEDLNRDGLVDTPRRAAKAFSYLTRGYGKNIKELISSSLFESDIDEMVVVKDIEIYSLCEHHLLPFLGKCHVAYIPNGKVIGLSKIIKVVDAFSKRLQIQENLTTQIANAIMEHLKPKGVGVIIEAKHLCMILSDDEKQNSLVKTSCMLGCFRDSEPTRQEFLSLIL